MSENLGRLFPAEYKSTSLHRIFGGSNDKPTMYDRYAPFFPELPEEPIDIVLPDYKKLNFSLILDNNPNGILHDPDTCYASPNLEATIHDPARVNTELPPSERKYQGPWYYQGFKPTCLPMTLANAHLVLDQPIQEEVISALVEYARGKNRDKEREDSEKNKGISYPKAVSMFEELNSGECEFVRVPREYELSTNRFNMLYTPLYPASDIPETKNDAVKRNAVTIKKFIDAGLPILTSVDHPTYSMTDNENRHAVCIAGYTVNDQGHMNIQVIDSARGILEISLEHLTKSFNPYTTYVFKPTSVPMPEATNPQIEIVFKYPDYNPLIVLASLALMKNTITEIKNNKDI